MIGFTKSKHFSLSALISSLSILSSSAAFAVAPDAPTGVIATAGNGSVAVAFTAPVNNGGGTITGYTATCGTKSNTGATSPIVVNALAGGTPVTCTVTASNADGTSAVSAISTSATPLLLTKVVSRKTHGSAGTFDLPIDRTQTIDGLATIDPRAVGTGHLIVFQFDGVVTSAGTVSVAPSGTATATFTTNEVIVSLNSIGNNQRVTLTLANVNGSVTPPSVAVGFLLGDVNSSGSVTASDVSAVKSNAGANTNIANAVYDVNLSGSINAADISAVKARIGGAMAWGPPSITSAAPLTATQDVLYCHPFAASQTIPSGGWSVSAGTAPLWVTVNVKRGAICGIPRSADVGTSFFTVSGVNSGGTASQAVALTVNAVVLPTPAINNVSPTSAMVGATITINGTALSSVTAVRVGTVTSPFTVNSTGTSITTTVPAMATLGLGSIVLETAASPTAATASFVVLQAGAGEFSVDGIPFPSISKFPIQTPNHGGLNGAGPYVNAYAMDPTRCNTSPALTRSWQHNIDLAAYRGLVASDLFSMRGDEALTYRVTIPTTDAIGGLTYQENISSGANPASAFMTISATPCDFDVTKRTFVTGSPTNQCYQSGGVGVSITWANYLPQPISRCVLTKGQTYYINIRFVDGISPATTCPNGVCGGALTFQ